LERTVALKAILDSIEGVNPVVAAEYKQREDGKYILDVEKVADGDNGELELAPVAKLRSALERERANNQTAQATIAKFKDLDPEKARQALTKLEEMKSWKPEQEVEKRIELLKNELATANKQEKEAIQQKLTRAQAQLKKTLVTNAAVTAIQEEGGNVKLLLPHVEASIRMRETENVDSPYLVEVINENGDPAVGDGAGNPMSIKQLIQKFKSSDDFASAFKASGTQGSGASNGAKGTQQQQSGNSRVLKTRDAKVLGANLDDIASGKVVVDMNS
jgi:hypothetical protein